MRTVGRELGFLRNMNLINPVRYLADGRPVFSTATNAATRLYPQFSSITLQDVGANSNYNAMVAVYTHRWNRTYSVSGSFTWSHTISDAPDANSFVQSSLIEDPANRERDRGNSLVNRPLAFTVTSVIEPTFQLSNRVLRILDNGNMLTIAGNISSGDQANITANAPSALNGDSVTTGQRPLYLGRDTWRGPNVFQVDMRYTRTLFTIHERIKPKILAEVNNITNHRNYTTFSTAVATTADGVAVIPATFAPTGGLEGRIIQLGIRLDW